MRTRNTICLLALTAANLLCGGGQIAGGGGGIEGEGRTVAGFVKEATGALVPGANVYLRPADFCSDTAAPTPAGAGIRQTQSDSAGAFRFDSVDTGVYLIEGLLDSGGNRPLDAFVACTVTAASESVSNDIFLGEAVTAQGTLDRSFVPGHAGVYLYAQGLDRVSRVDSGGAFVFPSLPAGAIDFRLIVFTGDTLAQATVSMTIAGDTTIPLLKFDRLGDSLAVAAILNDNGITATVSQVSLFKGDRIVSLQLGGMSVSTLPSTIGALTQLDTLVVERNTIASLPSELARCANLRVLRLAGNALTAWPGVLDSLKELTHLDMSYNSIAGPMPPSVSSLSRLSSLWLGFNSIDSLPPEIGFCALLDTLTLDQNMLRSLPPEVGSFAALRYLLLNNNILSSLPQEIGACTSLVVLSVQANNLDSLPASIGNLKNLRELRIFQNNINNLPLTPEQRANITVMNCWNNRLCALPAEVTAWLDSFDPGWAASQVCP